MVEDGGAKAGPLFGVGQRHLKAAPCHAHALRGNADAPAFQATQRNLVALALGANPVFKRNAALVKVDLRRVAAVLADLVFQPCHNIARRIGRHQKGAHALLAGALVGHGNDDGDVAVLATGDELLDAIQHIVIAVSDRCGAQGRGVAAHMRLGQAEGAEHLPLRQRREPVALLLRVAVAQQDGVDRAVGHADRCAGAAVAGSDFFQYQRQRHIVQPGAAQRFRHADAIGTQLRQALVDAFGKVVFLVPAGCVGPQLLLGKVAHRVADHFLVLGQQHGQSVSGKKG